MLELIQEITRCLLISTEQVWRSIYRASSAKNVSRSKVENVDISRITRKIRELWWALTSKQLIANVLEQLGDKAVALGIAGCAFIVGFRDYVRK